MRAGRDKRLARKERQNLLGSIHLTNTYEIFSICLYCSRNWRHLLNKKPEILPGSLGTYLLVASRQNKQQKAQKAEEI